MPDSFSPSSTRTHYPGCCVTSVPGGFVSLPLAGPSGPLVAGGTVGVVASVLELRVQAADPRRPGMGAQQYPAKPVHQSVIVIPSGVCESQRFVQPGRSFEAGGRGHTRRPACSPGSRSRAPSTGCRPPGPDRRSYRARPRGRVRRSRNLSCRGSNACEDVERAQAVVCRALPMCVHTAGRAAGGGHHTYTDVRTRLGAIGAVRLPVVPACVVCHRAHPESPWIRSLSSVTARGRGSAHRSVSTVSWSTGRSRRPGGTACQGYGGRCGRGR